MNRFFTQTLDKLTVSLFAPKFNAADNVKDRNLRLLNKPPLPPKRLIKTPKVFLKKVKSKGSVDLFHFAFPSCVETDSLQNNTVYGMYYKLTSRIPKSTVIVLHGMHERRHRRAEKHALNLIKNGHNCVVVTLPYHIERVVKRSYGGNQFFSTDLHNVFEALQQAVKDVMALINWLAVSGEKKIGLLGINLGALIAGLITTTTRKLNYVVMLAPATGALQITGYNVSGKLLEDRVRSTGLSMDQFSELFKPWELENHKPLVSPDRTFIMEAQYDTLIPRESVENLWALWGKPRIKHYHHGHFSILKSRRVFKDISRFLDEAFAHQQTAGLQR